MDIMAVILGPDGMDSRTIRVLNFLYEKEAYTPYTKLSVTFATDEIIGNPFNSPFDYSRVLFYFNGKCMHNGIIDYFKLINEPIMKKGVLKSRGFTSLLLDNHFEPGLHTNMSINKLIDDYYTFPYVTHESSSETSYIYVKPGSSMWDAVVNLSYKLHGTYPYIKGQNMIRMTAENPEQNIVLDDSVILSRGAEIKTRRLVSDFNMADLDDNYGNFYFENTQAKQRNIIRNRFFELDKRFLNEPANALNFRNAMQMRAWKRHFCVYNGTKREDLYDTVSFGDITNGRIKAIKVTGDTKGIQTELSVYEDLFTT